jgi:hypothetical protein
MPNVPLQLVDSKFAHCEENSMSNKTTIINSLSDKFPQQYIDNWFGADSFFSTNYLTGVLKQGYFITVDYFMGSEIYSVKLILSATIENVTGPLDTLELARKWVKENV